jgi:hypothetical protein
MYQKRAAILGLVIMASVGSPKASASDCDDLIARHMIGEAMLAAQCRSEEHIRELRDSGILPDTAGHAYLTNTGLDLRLAPTPRINPKRHHFGLCSMVGRKS